MSFVAWLHLVSAAVWLGGLITIGALIPVLRRAGLTREQLRAVARQFGTVSWWAMAVAVLTGLVRFWPLREALAIDSGFRAAVAFKGLLVGIVIVLASWHQTAAAEQSPQMRGLVEGSILLASLGIFAAALAL